VLTVSDGTHTANINVTGQYAAENFHVAADATNGTLVSYVLTGNITIVTGNCDDTVSLFNGTVVGNVSIKTQGGNDSVNISGTPNVGPLNITGGLLINEANGNDSLTFGGGFATGGAALNVNGNVGINMGGGNNSYQLTSNFKFGSDLLMTAAAGTDPINQLGTGLSSIAGKATFQPGGGQNTLLLPAGLVIGGNVTYSGGTGTDSVYDDAMIFGKLAVTLGAGVDRFTYGTSAFVSVAGAKINGGPPAAGDLYTQLLIPSWPNSVIGPSNAP